MLCMIEQNEQFTSFRECEYSSLAVCVPVCFSALQQSGGNAQNQSFIVSKYVFEVVMDCVNVMVQTKGGNPNLCPLG